MTLGKLIKELQKLEKKHGSRRDVSVECKSMYERYNCVFDIVNISKVRMEMVSKADGDGWEKPNSERPTILLS